MSAVTRIPWGGHIKAVQGVPGLHDVQSRTSDRIGTRMVYTSRNNSIMAIYGQSGVGKSFATARGAEMCAADPEAPAEVAWIQLTGGTQGKPLLRDLFPQITGTDAPARATTRQLESQLTAALEERHRVLVLDEAHLVRPNAMTVLRGLHDHPATDFALILVGMGTLITGLDSAMNNRVQTRIEMRPIADDAIVQVLCAYHNVFTTAHPDMLVMLNRTRARGEFRWWALFLANVSARIAGTKTRTLTQKLADDAAEDLR